MSAKSRESWLGSATSIAMLAAAALLLIAVLPYAAGYGHHRRTLLQILLKHWADPTWQHGVLAVPVAAFLVWRKRRELTALEIRPSAWGLVLMMLAGFLYFAGYKAHLIYFGFGAVQMLVAGSCLWLFGWRRTRACVFAWLMLSFTWPLLFLEESVAFHLRLGMVRCTHAVLSCAGVETIREGTALMSAASAKLGIAQGALFRLNIDAPCSGLRSLFALMMVGALFAHHRQQAGWKCWALFASTLPLAVIANMARILVLIAASAMFGQEFAVGSEDQEVSTFHFVSGLVVFIVALAGLELFSRLLSQFRPRRRPQPQAGSPAPDLLPPDHNLLPNRG